MPELPDVTIYVEALESRVVGQTLDQVRLYSIFVLRSVAPPVKVLHGKKVLSVRRLGKRIVLSFEDDLFLVIHLMIAGRLLWKDQQPAPKTGGKIGMAAFEFSSGTLTLTEASSKKRASIYVVQGAHGLTEHDRKGLDVMTCTPAEFESALKAENRTLKRALTNPVRFDGIGNAYSDEILHAARLSPMRLTQSLGDEEVRRLFLATKETLAFWIDKLRNEFGGKFPGVGLITAFRPNFATHGKYGKPCPVCGAPIQRIQYAENETNYCAKCQNEGRLLADRALSRLLKDDWPRTLEEMEGG